MDRLVNQLWECDVRYRESVREFKRRFIARVLAAHDGNQCAAADSLGMHRNTLARTITELKINFKHRGPGTGQRHADTPAVIQAIGRQHREVSA
jgi:transposase-like protein